MAFDWKATLSTVAPGLATALGGPVAGLATQAILSVFGLGENATEADIAKAIQRATPEQLLALKQAEFQFQLDMEKIGVDLEKIAAGDRDSARKRQMETKDKAPEVLGSVIIVGFLACVGAVLAGFVDGLKDPVTATTVGMLIGYVSAKADQVVSYYFGSSKASKAKDETIRKLSA